MLIDSYDDIDFFSEMENGHLRNYIENQYFSLPIKRKKRNLSKKKKKNLIQVLNN